MRRRQGKFSQAITRRGGLFQLAMLLATAVGMVAPLAASAAGEFEIETFAGKAVDASGQRSTQAGAHPDVTTRLELTTGSNNLPSAAIRNLDTDLPAGFVVNPSAVTTCSPALLAGAGGEPFTALCPGSAQVGTLEVTLNFGGGPFSGGVYPLYNIDAGPGQPPRVAANISSVIVNFESKVRTGGDYGITARIVDNSQTLPIQGSTVTLWGVPADEAHDSQRVCAKPGSIVFGCTAGKGRAPLVSYPGRCDGGLAKTSTTVSVWDSTEVRAASFDHDMNGDPLEVTGCDRLSFRPRLELQPESRVAAAPTGVEVKLAIPQSSDPDGLATALLRSASVTLPRGMAVNPASAAGQAGCAPGQIGIDNASEPSCPDASKLGSVEIGTPLLEEPLSGSVYLATQGTNPFNSLLALYVIAQGYEQTIKLAGKVSPDPQTGQLRVTFGNNPQLPFEEMRMRFKGGPGAPLTNPSACGTYTTHAELTSWARPNEVISSDSSFTIDRGCGNDAKFTPGFQAGTTNPIAGEHSPFTLRVTRPDGQQNLSRIEATLPEGLLAKLAGVPLCGDAEAASGNCPAASQVGAATVGSGAGSNPLYVPEPGKTPTAVYLAGPYKGAPYSLVAKVPAQAGPFDLGTVAVRNSIRVDPVTTQVAVRSDSLPQILKGIPVSYRDLRVEVDRPQFTLNPTSCDPAAIAGTIASAGGMSVSVSDRFQVADCGSLAFKPKLALKFSGPTHRSAHPKLTATLTMPEGGANIRRAQVTLPKTEFLEQSHIRTVCTRVQYAAKSCPAQSIYGYAKAWSPLLDKPLEGPVYLRSSNNPLPDLVASLDGQIHIDLAGRIDSVNSRIRNTFELVPDAPVSKFELTMQGGKKGLLVNNTNLCKAKPRADVRFDGQNGKTADFKSLVKTDCGKKEKKRKGGLK